MIKNRGLFIAGLSIIVFSFLIYIVIFAILSIIFGEENIENNALVVLVLPAVIIFGFVLLILSFFKIVKSEGFTETLKSRNAIIVYAVISISLITFGSFSLISGFGRGDANIGGGLLLIFGLTGLGTALSYLANLEKKADKNKNPKTIKKTVKNSKSRS